MKFLIMLVALTGSATAQVFPPPAPEAPPPTPPPLVAPDTAVLTGKSCPDKTPASVWIRGQDPETHYWSGIAYAQITCWDRPETVGTSPAATEYQGCADVTWDPTGTVIIAYKIRFQEVRDPLKLSGMEQHADINKRCFDGNAGRVL